MAFGVCTNCTSSFPLSTGQNGKITSQRLLDQSQAGVYRGKRHIPPHFRLFGAIRVPYPKGLELLL